MGRRSTYKWQRRAEEIKFIKAIGNIRKLNEEEKKRLDILREMLDNKTSNKR